MAKGRQPAKLAAGGAPQLLTLDNARTPTQRLLALADSARLALSSYRRVVKRMRRAMEGLQIARDYHSRGEPWPQTVESALHEYTSNANIVAEFWAEVHKVAENAPLLLPDVADELLHVRLASDRWHDQQDFPWDAAEQELLRIENSARRKATPRADWDDSSSETPSKNEAIVLRALFDTGHTMTNDAIENHARRANTPLSERTISDVVKAMIIKAWCDRPNGPKSGAGLTEKGKEIAAQLSRG